MKVIVKTLQNTTFPIEIESADTVLVVKQKIEASQSHPIDRQKLIHGGRICLNEKTVADYDMKEGDQMVIMLAPPKKPAAQASQVASETLPAKPDSTAHAAPKSVTKTDSITAVDATLVPAENEDAIKGIVAMGFDRSEVIRAMQASFNNPERAVEYLTNGIPDNILGEESEASGTPVNAEAIFNFLRNDPQFNQLRAVVSQNPALLAPLLEQISQANPELFALINQNQTAFMRLLQEPGEAGEEDGEEEDGEEFEMEGEGDAARQSGQVEIAVSEEEQAAIERLEGLGFERIRVIEAYFACDKDETLAANYLFDHANEE